jgi:sulfate-transporting ATPase
MVLVNRHCLKIIAGVIKIIKVMWFFQDYSVGYLEQEPKLDDSKTVLEVVKEGAAETVAILR